MSHVADWLLDPAVAHLNHGGLGALPRVVADAADRRRVEVEANPSDLMFRRLPGLIDLSRSAAAELLGADPRNCVFVQNATTGTATVLAALDLGPDDEVLTTDHRYPAVPAQLGAIAARRGVRVVEQHVSVDVKTAADVVDAVLAGVTSRTRAVVVDHVASPTGLLFPVQELAAAAHAAGVPLIVDAAHAPGMIDVDLATLGADAWVGNLHKWICTPRGLAVLHVTPPWQDVVRPLVASHDYFEGYQPAFDWTGTSDVVPMLTVPAAIAFWAKLGWDQVRASQRALATEGARHVAERIGTRVAIADEHTAAMRIVELPRPLDADGRIDLINRLMLEHGVVVHVTEHAGTTYVRMCGQVYNTPDDYERLADALLSVHASRGATPSTG